MGKRAMERVQNTPDTPEQTFCPPRPEEQAAGVSQEGGDGGIERKIRASPGTQPSGLVKGPVAVM